MSASETGEEAPLIQFFSSVRCKDSASRPASRTVSFSSVASLALTSSRSSRKLTSANRQALDAQRRRVHAIAEFQIVGRHQRFEHVEQMAGDRDLADGIFDLAILEIGRASCR